jgi:hypothetical protein
MSKQPESVLKTQILTYLIGQGYFVWNNPSQGTFDPVKRIYRAKRGAFNIKGTSDILGIKPGGQLLAIEVKTKTGRVSPEQKRFIEQITAMGGHAFVARSIEDCEAQGL